MSKHRALEKEKIGRIRKRKMCLYDAAAKSKERAISTVQRLEKN
jgi:hypothetical protein